MSAPEPRGAAQNSEVDVAANDDRNSALTLPLTQGAAALRIAAALADLACRCGDPTRAIGSAVLANLIVGVRS